MHPRAHVATHWLVRFIPARVHFPEQLDSDSLSLSLFFYSVLFWGALILEMPRQMETNYQMPLMA